MDEQRLLQLFQVESGRRFRVEAPIVFGRSTSFYDYAEEGGRAFSAEVLETLTRLDFVSIGGARTVSRTHGLLDPVGPTLKDLNSYNGIEVNGHRIPPTNAQGEGPALDLHHGDVIRIGSWSFVVDCAQAGARTFFGQLWDHRYAIAAPAADPDLASVAELLDGSRRFTTRLAADWQALEAELDLLEAAAAKGEGTGISAIVLHLGVHAAHLELGGERRHARDLIKRLKAIQGSKILAIQAEGDPSALEALFEDEAEFDSILLTTTLPDAAPLRTDSVEEELCSFPLDRVGRGTKRDSLAAYHGLYDGLESLVRADSNLLDLSWYVNYQGALTLTIGGAQPPRDEEIGTAYLLTPGSAPMSRRTYSFR